MSDSECRVLVVDDDFDVANALAELLSVNGYVVRTANDGLSALAMVKEFRPDCVLLDIRMPGIDGLDLTRQLRAAYRDDLVLVAVTGGSADESRVAQTFDLVDHYLAKPIDIKKLEKILPPRST